MTDVTTGGNPRLLFFLCVVMVESRVALSPGWIDSKEQNIVSEFLFAFYNSCPLLLVVVSPPSILDPQHIPALFQVQASSQRYRYHWD